MTTTLLLLYSVHIVVLVEIWSPFPFLLSLGCPCDFLFPVELSTVQWANSEPHEDLHVFTQSLESLPTSAHKPQLAYWVIRNHKGHSEPRCSSQDPRQESSVNISKASPPQWCQLMANTWVDPTDGSRGRLDLNQNVTTGHMQEAINCWLSH